MRPTRNSQVPDGTRFRRAIVVVLALLGACARPFTASPMDGGGEASKALPLTAWRMRATLAPGAESVAVQMCFDGEPPTAVKVGTPDAEEHIENVRIVGREPDVALAGEDGQYDTSALASGECLE